MYRQTKSALAHIDATLRDAGTDKSRILTAIVYIADMTRKPDDLRLGRMGRPQQSADARVPRGDARRRNPGGDRCRRRRVGRVLMTAQESSAHGGKADVVRK